MKEIRLIEIYDRATKEAMMKNQGMKTFSQYQTDTHTSKIWITPDGEVLNLHTWHHNWIVDNKDELKKKYGLKLKKTDEIAMNETPIRLAALNVGFFRVNYNRKDGSMIIEGNAKFFTKNIKDVIFMLVQENRNMLDSIVINILDDKGRSIKHGSAYLYMYDDNEKLEHIPLITESIRRRYQKK